MLVTDAQNCAKTTVALFNAGSTCQLARKKIEGEIGRRCLDERRDGKITENRVFLYFFEQKWCRFFNGAKAEEFNLLNAFNNGHGEESPNTLTVGKGDFAMDYVDLRLFYKHV